QYFWGYSRSDGEVGVGEHGESDVAVPGVVAADLVVVESDLGLRGLEAVLDGPAGAGDPDEGVVAGAGGCEAHVVGDLEFTLAVGGQRPACEQPAAPTRGGGPLVDRQRGHRPVEHPRPFRAVAAAQTLPRLWWCLREEVIGAGGAGSDRDPLAAWNRHHIPDVAGFEPAPELVVATVGLVRGDPAGRDPAVQRSREHLLCEGGFRGELHAIGDVRLSAAVTVLGPRLRQIEFPIDQRATLAGGVGAEDAQLAVLYPSRRSRVLTLYPSRFHT